MMRRAFVLTVTVSLATAAAGAAHATVVEKTKFKGNQVATLFSGSAAITCADGSAGTFSASGFLSGSRSVIKTKGTPKTVNNGIFVDVSFFDSCTGESRSASGGIADGLTPPNHSLASAALSGSTLVQDFNDGAQFPFEVDVAVAGEGPISAGSSHTHTRTMETPGGPVTITHTHNANANRSGAATGTVTIAGVELAPEFSSTTLSRNADAQIVIER